MYVKLLPNFYQTDFNDLPATTELDRDNLVLWLRQDNARGAVIMGDSPETDVAVWTGDESGADACYYTAFLPLGDPDDASFEGTAKDAVYSV